MKQLVVPAQDCAVGSETHAKPDCVGRKALKSIVCGSEGQYVWPLACIPVCACVRTHLCRGCFVMLIHGWFCDARLSVCLCLWEVLSAHLKGSLLHLALEHCMKHSWVDLVGSCNLLKLQAKLLQDLFVIARCGVLSMHLRNGSSCYFSY